jgi:hypothetical protein
MVLCLGPRTWPDSNQSSYEVISLVFSAPPSSIEIVGHAPNSKIEIKENQEYQLECLVKNSKPAARIVWYRGNVELKLGE